MNKTASRNKRFVNFILDIIFFTILSVIIAVILGVVIVIVSPESLSFFEKDNKLIHYLFNFIVAMIYYSTFEFLTGRTIAKYITKTKVITENGEKPDFRTIIIRSLCRFIPFEPFTYLGSESSGLHDQLSKTRVVEI